MSRLVNHNALRAMTPEKRQELYESLREAPSDSSGPQEVNNTETSASGPEDTVEISKEKVVTDGDLIVQQVIKDMSKAKKVAKAAAQYKKAGNTKSEAHPVDTRKMMSQPKGKQKRSGFTVRWERSRLPPPTDTELILRSEDPLGSDERKWLEIKRAVHKLHNSPDPPTPKEAWDKTLLIARDIEARKAICDELKTEVPLVPPDEKNSEESVANESNCRNTVTSLRLPPWKKHWVSQGYLEAYCMGCISRGYTEEYCADCYEISHYDMDGNTIESIGSDCVPPSSVMTFAQMAAASPADEERARRQACDRKHYLPPSQCHFEDLEFDFRSYHSEDSEDIVRQTFPSLEVPDESSSSSDSSEPRIPP